MIEKIDNNQIPEIPKEAAGKQVNPPKSPVENQADDSLQVNYDSLIEKVKQTSPEDDKAVQQARELLASGQLESPENIRAAAENIVKFGI